MEYLDKLGPVYSGHFGDEQDVFSNFEVDEKDRQGIKIIFANYDTPEYEGYAYVVFWQDGKLYEVSGSHCSCYGLEGQWDPEEILMEELKHRITKGTLGKDFFDEDLMKILKEYSQEKETEK